MNMNVKKAVNRMNNFKFDNDLTRVNKTRARALYNNGVTVRICMNKINPINDFYHLYTDINNKEKYDFDKLVNSYEFYNGNYECGYYCSFYVKGGE